MMPTHVAEDYICDIFMKKLDSLRLFSQRIPMPHFWGCGPRGLSPPNSNSD